MGEVEGRRIVVTGCFPRSRPRFCVCARCSGRDDVVVNGTNADLTEAVAAEIVADGGSALAVVGSVADDSFAEHLVASCIGEFGGIDAVVNNAGIVRDRTLMNMTPEEFDEVIAVNLRGTWSTSRHAARAMKDQGHGLLLQVISGSAFVGSVGQTNYAASKAGVMGMLYAWDVEMRRFGIRTNALWPIAETDMTQVVFEGARRRAEVHGSSAPSPQEMGFGKPADIAPIVVYLCSQRADHLRSQLFTFNGSRLAVWEHPHETQPLNRATWTVDDLAEALHDASHRSTFPTSDGVHSDRRAPWRCRRHDAPTPGNSACAAGRSGPRKDPTIHQHAQPVTEALLGVIAHR
jgi:3-oxoacyl-[acyl-carrier protein] reductase